MTGIAVDPDRPVARLVAANMRRIRKMRGMNQKELGNLLSLSEASVSAAERSVDGSRVRVFDIDEVAKIASVLEVSISDLIEPVPPCACCGDNPPPGMRCKVCKAEGPEFEGSGR